MASVWKRLAACLRRERDAARQESAEQRRRAESLASELRELRARVGGYLATRGAGPAAVFQVSRARPEPCVDADGTACAHLRDAPYGSSCLKQPALLTAAERRVGATWCPGRQLAVMPLEGSRTA